MDFENGWNDRLAIATGSASVQPEEMSADAEPILALESTINLGDWAPDEEFQYHPIGSKPKRNYICPPGYAHPLMIPGHTYLFKVAQGWRAGQMWSEALAYQLGRGAGLDVPPCFIAYDPRTLEWGALIEFFVGYPGEIAPKRLIHGADLLQGKGFTAGADRPHNLRTNIEVCAEMGIDRPHDWWVRLVTFDTLIGNTDRHTQNWGILLDSANVPAMAPVFDNGTSFGYMHADQKLAAFAGEKLERFVAEGMHHMSWDLANEKRTCHIDLYRELMTFDNAGKLTDSVIQSGLGVSGRALEACLQLEVDPAFTRLRVEFVNRLLTRRGEVMMDVLKGL